VRLDWKGPSLTDRLSDLLGRKWTLYALWVILALVRAASYPIALTAVSCSRERRKDLASMAGRKAFVGIGVGTLQATVAPYICRCIESRLPQLLTVSGEWSPVNLRGALIMWYSIWFSIGGSREGSTESQSCSIPTLTESSSLLRSCRYHAPISL
jgi:MFS family permease